MSYVFDCPEMNMVLATSEVIAFDLVEHDDDDWRVFVYFKGERSLYAGFPSELEAKRAFRTATENWRKACGEHQS